MVLAERLMVFSSCCRQWHHHVIFSADLSALDEAAGMDVLCADKTGTLTRNELSVTACQALPGFEEAQVLAMATLACSDGGTDPLDAAIRVASPLAKVAPWTLLAFNPFDPAKKMSEASANNAEGSSTSVSFNKPLHFLRLIAALLQETSPAARLWQDKSISSQLTQQASRYATGHRCIRATSHDRPAGFWPLAGC